MGTTIYFSQVAYNDWKLYLGATAEGLCFVSAQMEDVSQLEQHVRKYVRSFTLEKNEHLLKNYKEQLIDYFEGKRTTFDCSLDLYGTAFQKRVWNTLTKIPYGKTVTYSDIAENIGKPQAHRAVGNAVGENPVLIVIPCHRVIRKNGDLGGFREGLNLKKTLLELERKVNNSLQ